MERGKVERPERPGAEQRAAAVGGLLVVCWTLTQFALTRLPEADFPAPQAIVGLAAAFAQVGAAVAYLVLARGQLLLRVALWIAACFLSAWLISRFTSRELSPWLGFLMVYSSVAAILVAILRMLGYSLTLQVPGPTRQRQFTLGRMMIWTTCVAGLLGTLRLASLPLEFIVEITCYSIGFTVVTVLAGGCVLARQWHVGLRIVAAIIGLPLVGFVLSFLERLDTPALAAMTGLQGLLVAAAAAVLAVAGFALHRVRPEPPDAGDPASVPLDESKSVPLNDPASVPLNDPASVPLDKPTPASDAVPPGDASEP